VLDRRVEVEWDDTGEDEVNSKVISNSATTTTTTTTKVENTPLDILPPVRP